MLDLMIPSLNTTDLQLFVIQRASSSYLGCNWIIAMLLLVGVSLSRTQMQQRHVVVVNPLQHRCVVMCTKYLTENMHNSEIVTDFMLKCVYIRK
ncbi:hypothetical protein NC653_012477 [Populus alba x Populus x berolinensis]|uniref:Uncharacterized protein n=1 Tax=Populus alba x Populus x berolinensis TaxID=444605 RepID=A0AAD6QS41_9ROSI|nr:hypothetical protein NC653_012477 [Populus alba x Populus x berolinensis]